MPLCARSGTLLHELLIACPTAYLTSLPCAHAFLHANGTAALLCSALDNMASNDTNLDKLSSQPLSDTKTSTPLSKSGWDGKLRVEKKAVLSNPEALTDPEYSDEDAPPVDQIQADEGVFTTTS